MAFTSAATIPWTRIKALSFDIFGTLIDWEGGITQSIRATSLGPYLPFSQKELLIAIEKEDTQVQREHPTMKQSDVIAEGLRRYAATLDVIGTGKLTQEQVDQAAKEYGSRIGSYPAFDDTVKAIQRLGKHYKLFPLTNVDNESYAQTLAGPLKGCEFTASYTAENIGSYKPSLNNFHYLFDHIKRDHEVERDELVHVAQSLFHDHGPAGQLDLTSVWVDRKGFMGGNPEDAQDKFAFQLRVESLAELAEIVDRSFG